MQVHSHNQRFRNRKLVLHSCCIRRAGCPSASHNRSRNRHKELRNRNRVRKQEHIRSRCRNRRKVLPNHK
ncbi:hypothetical protein RESH_03698 [Rhodopirellula europaea SH398]|uniref:Uncharacterized protein n=1 Tax=Rhodopirellula europaea SH398 TaxID=1263868 RepID=M5SDE5_9BACT|nr:hypothetical protein RESH_03698 [Rhodopirellula europaea SH398]